MVSGARLAWLGGMPRKPDPKRERNDPRLMPRMHDEDFALVSSEDLRLERSRFERLIDEERRREGGQLLRARFV